MNFSTLRASAFLSAVFMMCLAGHSAAGDYAAAHIASPGQYQVIFENEHVLVLKMILKPGEEDVLHSHNNETVYFQKGGQLTISLPNGQSQIAEVPDGHVMWHEAWSHQVTNSGSSEVLAIIVEEK